MVLIRLALILYNLMVAPKSCMPNSPERPLEVHKDSVKVLLVFFTEYFKNKNLLS